jgi:hypothetical protein
MMREKNQAGDDAIFYGHFGKWMQPFGRFKRLI